MDLNMYPVTPTTNRMSLRMRRNGSFMLGVLYVGNEATNQNDSGVLPLSDSWVEGKRWICLYGGGEWPMARAEGLFIEGLVSLLRWHCRGADRASSFHPNVDAESIDSLRPESTDRLTSYFSYFEESSTESESGEIWELETISGEDDCVFIS